MAYDPNQPRDKIGRWTVAGNAAWAASGVVSDRAKRFAARMNDGTSKFSQPKYMRMSTDELLQIAGNQPMGGRSIAYEEQLKNSIGKYGVTEPVQLLETENGDLKFEDGMHRLSYAKELGIQDIPVTIRMSGQSSIIRREIPFDDEIVEIAQELGIRLDGSMSAAELAKMIQEIVNGRL